MMAPRRGYRRQEETRVARRPLGLLLALFALVCQNILVLAPLPALGAPADATLFDGGYVLCHAEDDGTATPGRTPDKSPAHPCVDCPLCQAFHVAGNLVPPPLPALLPPSATTIALVPAVAAAQPQRLVATAHQPRAPPSVTRL